MPRDPDYGRLEKTVRLLDSPVAGEQAAALEAIGRQFGALGLSWADVAPKFRAFDAKPKVTAAERQLFKSCSWTECAEKTIGASPFCEIHITDIIREPLQNFVTFLDNLATAVNAETAGNALYHAVHNAVHIGMFNPHVGHNLVRAASASRDGSGVAATIDKLTTTIGIREQGEFMMHLKRQLVLPERRSARREAAA
jgi:hypothetical protein